MTQPATPEKPPAPRASPAARVTLLMACMFSVMGVTLVFLPRWLEGERGLAGAEIGALLSLAHFGRIITGPAIALWADGQADWRTPLRWVASGALAAAAAFLCLARDFTSLLVCGFVALSLTQAMIPLLEAALLRATARGGLSYGVGRGLGSVSFIFANVAGGALIARFGLGALVVWTLTALAAMTLSAWFALERERFEAPRRRVRLAERLRAARALLCARGFLALIVSAGLIQSGHAFYYGFSAIVWRAQGLPADRVGLLWAFGVAVEVAFLWSLGPIERRVSPRALLIAGACAGALRWTAMGFTPAPLLLWPLQGLHALSFAAAHVGAMRLLARHAPENAAVMGQTLYAVMSAGILIGFATLLSGALYESVGARGYWAMAAIAALGGAGALLLGDGPRGARESIS